MICDCLTGQAPVSAGRNQLLLLHLFCKTIIYSSLVGRVSNLLLKCDYNFVKKTALELGFLKRCTTELLTSIIVKMRSALGEWFKNSQKKYPFNCPSLQTGSTYCATKSWLFAVLVPKWWTAESVSSDTKLKTVWHQLDFSFSQDKFSTMVSEWYEMCKNSHCNCLFHSEVNNISLREPHTHAHVKFTTGSHHTTTQFPHCFFSLVPISTSHLDS